MRSLPERKILRKMNFLSDQEGIISRFLNERSNWEPHLQKSREFILDWIHGKNISVITILGSGWLLDVPLEELQKKCEKILLVDIFHPPQILRKIRDLSTVEAIQQDITGGMIEQVYHLVEEFRKTGRKRKVADLHSPGFTPDFNPDFVVSLNILNQLDILIIDYLKKFSIFTEEEILTLRKKIQQSHIDSLPLDHSCIITDFEELVSQDDRLERVNKLIHVPLPEGKRKATWEWLFDSQKTYYRGKTTRFNVVAIEL
jgi:hypothetical protein